MILYFYKMYNKYLFKGFFKIILNFVLMKYCFYELE